MYILLLVTVQIILNFLILKKNMKQIFYSKIYK